MEPEFLQHFWTLAEGSDEQRICATNNIIELLRKKQENVRANVER